MSKNKVKFGLSNVHIFPITDEENGKPIYDNGFVIKQRTDTFDEYLDKVKK